MSKLIDISIRLRGAMPVWPGSAGFSLEQTQTIANGDPANVSKIEMDVHCGTHVEAPLHFVDGGEPLESFPLDTFVGPARVVHLLDADSIGTTELADVPAGVERLLIRTRNSDAWASRAAFSPDFVALTVHGAQWIAERGIRLVGVDFLSVQRWGDDSETHRILMDAGVAILEGINLSSVPTGEYRLTCLPLPIDGAEASPVRAVLEVLP